MLSSKGTESDYYDFSYDLLQTWATFKFYICKENSKRKAIRER